MSHSYKNCTESDIVVLLRNHGINPTAQRVLITQALFAQATHLAAEDLYRLLINTNTDSPYVSKATVYNTLGLLAEKGIIRAVIADPARVFYDPNVSPHHHFYDETTGELTDIDARDVRITGLPPLPEGSLLQGVDVVIRLKRTAGQKDSSPKG